MAILFYHTQLETIFLVKSVGEISTDNKEFEEAERCVLERINKLINVKAQNQ